MTVKVDDELKERMERLDEVNWSETLRDRIREVLDEKEELAASRVRALRLNKSVHIRPPPGYDSARLVREVREERDADLMRR